MYLLCLTMSPQPCIAHAQVRGSSVESRRSFLIEKGLSATEIEEAFRRVPDPPSASASPSLPSGLPAAPGPQAPQKPFPTGGTSSGAISSTLAQLQATQPPPPPLQPIRWTQVALVECSLFHLCA